MSVLARARTRSPPPPSAFASRAALRSALQVLDYADESVVPLKKLLLHCAIRPLMLRCAEGRKLLVYAAHAAAKRPTRQLCPICMRACILGFSRSSHNHRVSASLPNVVSPNSPRRLISSASQCVY
eukprot:4301299-Pleurochrysis_carterae.AAC.1